MSQTNISAATNNSAKNLWFVESYVKRCPHCGAVNEMLTTLGAAEFLERPIYEVYRKAERGEIHTVATSHGLLLVCRDSLTKVM